MDLFSALSGLVDRLDPDITAFLDHFSDGRVPLRLSFAIVVAAAALLAILIGWGAVALTRIHRLRRLVRSLASGGGLRANLRQVDAALSQSMFGAAWAEYRECLKEGEDRVLYPRRPDEYLGLHAIGGASFPSRFFAAVHGYFVGVGLLLTFIGLVAALKFASAGVASSDLVVAKQALNALLSAASFKFMTSIAGLGCSLVLSVASRTMTYLIESEAQGLAGDLERGMAPIFTECLAYDQLAATRAQLGQLERIGSTLASMRELNAGAASARSEASTDARAADHEALAGMLKTFAAEMRHSTGSEMNQLAVKLSEVGAAIGGMQHHIDNSGQLFADQLNLASSHLLNAAITLQESVDARINRVGDRIDALAETFAKSEQLFASAANNAARGMAQSIKGVGDEIAVGVVKATHALVATSDSLAQRLGGVLGGFDTFNQSMQSQVSSMREIVSSLNGARNVLDASASIWERSAAPVIASVDASRRVVIELGQVADRVSTTQHDMAQMAKAVTQLSDKTTVVWENYRARFEKVDDDLQAVFDRLQGGTRAFGKEVMDFVGELDASLTEGMQALSVGTDELRKVAEILAVDVKAKAA